MGNFRVVLVCVLGMMAVMPISAEDGCAGWDDLADDMLFAPVRDEITKANKSRMSIPDFQQTVGWHTALSAVNGSVGDLTSVQLSHFRGAKFNASTLCQTGNDTHTNITIALDVELKNLGVTYENFLLKIPILPNIGNTRTSVVNSGNAVSVSVSVLTTPSVPCDVQLNYFQIHDLGSFSVHFDHGVWNTIYQGLFNMSSRLIKWGLGRSGQLKTLEDQITSQVYDMAQKQSSEVCEIIHNILG